MAECLTFRNGHFWHWLWHLDVWVTAFWFFWNLLLNRLCKGDELMTTLGPPTQSELIHTNYKHLIVRNFSLKLQTNGPKSISSLCGCRWICSNAWIGVTGVSCAARNATANFILDKAYRSELLDSNQWILYVDICDFLRYLTMWHVTFSNTITFRQNMLHGIFLIKSYKVLVMAANRPRMDEEHNISVVWTRYITAMDMYIINYFCSDWNIEDPDEFRN